MAGTGSAEVYHPNREKPESKTTRTIVFVLLCVTAGLMLFLTLFGWSVSQGLQAIQLFLVVVYSIFAFYVLRWNRGVLATAAGLSMITIVFAAVAGVAWFGRDKAGFDEPILPVNILGILTLLLVPVLLLLIAFCLQGFRQAWNVEEGVPISEYTHPHHHEPHSSPA